MLEAVHFIHKTGYSHVIIQQVRLARSMRPYPSPPDALHLAGCASHKQLFDPFLNSVDHILPMLGRFLMSFFPFTDGCAVHNTAECPYSRTLGLVSKHKNWAAVCPGVWPHSDHVAAGGFSALAGPLHQGVFRGAFTPRNAQHGGARAVASHSPVFTPPHRHDLVYICSFNANRPKLNFTSASHFFLSAMFVEGLRR